MKNIFYIGHHQEKEKVEVDDFFKEDNCDYDDDSDDLFGVFSVAKHIKRVNNIILDYKTCHCQNCKKDFELEYEYSCLNHASHYREDDNNIEPKSGMIVCPNCNNSVKELKLLKTDYCCFREWFINKDDKLRLAVMNFNYSYANGHIYAKKTYNIITINLKTGFSYHFPAIVNGKKSKGSLYNTTYMSSFGIDSKFKTTSLSDNTKDYDVFIKEIYDYIREYKIKKYGNYIPTFDEIDHKIKMSNIFLFNRFPFLSMDLSNKLFSELKFKNISKSFFNKMEFCRRNFNQDYNKIDMLLNMLDIPATKKMKSELNNKGIKLLMNYKIINKYISLDNFYKISNLSYECFNQLAEFCKNYNPTTQNINNFCNKIKRYYDNRDKNKPDTGFYLSLDILPDTLSMLNRIHLKNDTYSINWRLSIKELHDQASSDYNKVTRINKEIDYDQLSELQTDNLEGEFNGLKFTLAKNTHELIDVGISMNICVGSYDNRAIRKSCVIALARKNNNNILCIELDSNANIARQVKAKYNHLPEGEALEAFLQWAKINNILIDTYDIKPDIKEQHNGSIQHNESDIDIFEDLFENYLD